MKLHRIAGAWAPLLVCLCTGAAAQENQPEAPAIAIPLLTSDIQVAAGGSSVQTLHVEATAANQAGVQRLGQASIAYDMTGQEIAVVEAHTLKADGKTTYTVDAGAIYDQAPPGLTAAAVTGLRSKLIIFPQFAIGDTAVYTVKITTRHPNFAGQFVYGGIFPRTQAYNDVRETVTAPKSFPLYVESHQVDAGKREDGGNVTYSWHYSQTKPLSEEPVSLFALDQTPRFFVSSFKDYAQLGQAYAAQAEPKKIVTPKVQALADQITAGTSDPKAQTQKLYEWVSSHIRYVAIELGTGSFVPHDVEAIINNGYGDCKDHDLLLQTLLKAKGIAAQSILINAGAVYTMTDVPTFTTLDHAITFVPQWDLYLDSTAGVAPFGTLPLSEYGKPMVVASATSAKLDKMPVLQPGIAKIAIKTVSAMDTSGQISATTTTTASGPYTIPLRMIGQGIEGLGPNGGPRMLSALGFQNPSGGFTMDAPTGLTLDYTITATYKASGWADNLANGSGFYMPPGPRLLGHTGDDVMGPFDPGNMKPGEATVCLSAEQSEDLSLKAPPGYQFFGMPSDVRVQTPNLLFVAHWSLAGDTLSVHRDFTSKIDQPLCQGSTRTQTAAALKQISDSYDFTISFAKGGGGGGDKTKSAALGFFNSGDSHLNAGENELAIADFGKALALNADDYLSLYGRGFAEIKLKQFAPALADLDQAIKLKADDGRAYNNRGWAHVGLNQTDLAIADFSKAVALQPGDTNSYLERGWLYFASGKDDLALPDFEKVIALGPEGPEAYHAYLYRAQASVRLAYADMMKKIKQISGDGTISKADFDREHANFAAQRMQGLADIDKAIALQPNAPEAYAVRAHLYEDMGRRADAIADLGEIVTLQPDNSAALFVRAKAYVDNGQFALAFGDYDKLLASKPDSADWLAARGFAHLQAKEYALAIADLDKAIALNPNSSDAFLYRGDAKNKLGRKKEGDSDIAQAVKLNPALGK